MTKNVGDIYDESYYMDGVSTGKSLYHNYRWLPELTLPMVESIINHCGIARSHTIMDFGCARGYTVKALRMLEYLAFGVDVSRWAIANADPEVRKFCYLANEYPPIKWEGVDWVIAKDVLEHCEYVGSVIDTLMAATKVGLFAVVPLTRFNGGNYVVENYELDITHTQRFNLHGWVKMFLRPGWSVTASYRVKGVKDNYANHKTGNGFITCRRIED